MNSKEKSSEIKSYSLCLGNILSDFTINKMEQTGLKGLLKVISVDCNDMILAMF